MIDAIFRSTFGFEYLILGPKRYRVFRETCPWLARLPPEISRIIQYQDWSLPLWENLVQHHWGLCFWHEGPLNIFIHLNFKIQYRQLSPGRGLLTMAPSLGLYIFLGVLGRLIYIRRGLYPRGLFNGSKQYYISGRDFNWYRPVPILLGKASWMFLLKKMRKNWTREYSSKYVNDCFHKCLM